MTLKTEVRTAFADVLKKRILVLDCAMGTMIQALKLDEDQAELIWRTLINWNVNYEKGIIVARRRSE